MACWMQHCAPHPRFYRPGSVAWDLIYHHAALRTLGRQQDKEQHIKFCIRWKRLRLSLWKSHPGKGPEELGFFSGVGDRGGWGRGVGKDKAQGTLLLEGGKRERGVFSTSQSFKKLKVYKGPRIWKLQWVARVWEGNLRYANARYKGLRWDI